jgi:hypothetical protein
MIQASARAASVACLLAMNAAACGYLGSGEVFDRSIAAFAVAYADQCERDYERMAKAVRDGKVKAHMEN